MLNIVLDRPRAQFVLHCEPHNFAINVTLCYIKTDYMVSCHRSITEMEWLPGCGDSAEMQGQSQVSEKVGYVKVSLFIM